MGEYERELIRERILAGQKRARAQGIKIGRPSKLNEAVRTSVKLLRENGMGIKEISKHLEIGVGSVYSSLNLSPIIGNKIRQIRNQSLNSRQAGAISKNT